MEQKIKKLTFEVMIWGRNQEEVWFLKNTAYLTNEDKQHAVNWQCT